MTNKIENRRIYASVRKKLVAAVSMLLLSAIMLVSSTYAWLVLSTAPEVTGIQTQVGANGALEIALLNNESWNHFELLDRGDIDESAEELQAGSNLTWGNLVDLSDSSYGLDKIILNPSRLYLEKDGDGYKINNTILKTPNYGEDGRVKGLDKDKAVAYIYKNGQFSEEGYGVRAIGTSAEMSIFQLGVNSAVSVIATQTSAARTAASNALNENGAKMANIVIAYALNGKESGYGVSDVEGIKTLAEDLKVSLGYIETGLRNVFAGYIATGNVVSQADYAAALAEINDPETALTALQTKYSGISSVVPAINTYITTLTANQTKVDDAIRKCDEAIAAGRNNMTWTEIVDIVNPLVQYDKMKVGDKSITELKNSLKNPDGSINYSEAMNLVSDGGFTITVPTGSGLVSDVADFAGDYTANVRVENVTLGSIGPMDVDTKMTTATTANPVYLTEARTAIRKATVSTATGSNTITDYYGYAIDLAFRTNAVNSNLLLSTDAKQRIYEDSQNSATQGGGSFMSFTTQAGLSATKMVKLMSGIRVVFMDKEQNVKAVAALDCTLGKDSYTELSDEEKTNTKKYAYLNGGAGAYQNSDLIDYDTYAALPDESEVEFDRATGEVKASLYLYRFSLTVSDTSTEEEIKYTGGMTLGEKLDSSAITALSQDIVQCLTAVVYLDGSFVNNSMVAADSAQSMVGKLNLQFASDADLIPAQNTALHKGTEDIEYTQLATAGESYTVGTLTGAVKTGYTIYEGSDGKYYYSTDGTTYVELTLANAGTAIETSP